VSKYRDFEAEVVEQESAFGEQRMDELSFNL
jgi:hypothetical protein